jgi:hypothetical protein
VQQAKSVFEEDLRIGRRETNVRLQPIDLALQFRGRLLLHRAAQELAEVRSVISLNVFHTIGSEPLNAILSEVERVLVEPLAKLTEAGGDLHRSDLSERASAIHSFEKWRTRNRAKVKILAQLNGCFC